MKGRKFDSGVNELFKVLDAKHSALVFNNRLCIENKYTIYFMHNIIVYIRVEKWGILTDISCCVQ